MKLADLYEVYGNVLLFRKDLLSKFDNDVNKLPVEETKVMIATFTILSYLSQQILQEEEKSKKEFAESTDNLISLIASLEYRDDVTDEEIQEGEAWKAHMTDLLLEMKELHCPATRRRMKEKNEGN